MNNTDISGNGIENLGNQIGEVLDKFENETANNADEEYDRRFYESYLKIIDKAMGQYWDMNRTRGIDLNLVYIRQIESLTKTISPKLISSMLWN